MIPNGYAGGVKRLGIIVRLLILVAVGLLTLTPTPILSQSSGSGGTITGKGTITPGDCVSWASGTQIQDTGSACGGGTGTVTSVSGTTNQVDVATATTTPVVSLDPTLILPGTISLKESATTGTGAYQFTSNGVNPTTYPGLWTFGDSIAVGVGSGNSATGISGFAYLMDPDFWEPNATLTTTNVGTSPYACAGTPVGSQLHNYACSADQAADMVKKVLAYSNPSTKYNPTYLGFVGGNDATNNSANTPPTFQGSLRASIDWATTPSAYKVLASAATASGTWVTNTGVSIHGGGNGLVSTTNGSTLTFTIQSTGNPIELGYRWWSTNNGGTATVTIDSSSATDTYSGSTTLEGCQNTSGGACTTWVNTLNGATDTIVMARFAGVAAGSHTVVVTITSSTSSANQFGVVWVGTAPGVPVSSYYAGGNLGFVGGNCGVAAGSPAGSTLSATCPGNGYPQWFQAGVPREGVLSGTECNAASTATYDGYEQSVLSGLAADGHASYYVPIRQYLNSTTDIWADFSGTCSQPNKHPNSVGHGHIRDAFEQTILATNATHGPINSNITLATPIQNTGSNTPYSPSMSWCAQGYNGSASIPDCWNVTAGVLAGTNSNSGLIFQHVTGSTGTPVVEFSNVASGVQTSFAQISNYNGGAMGLGAAAPSASNIQLQITASSGNPAIIKTTAAVSQYSVYQAAVSGFAGLFMVANNSAGTVDGVSAGNTGVMNTGAVGMQIGVNSTTYIQISSSGVISFPNGGPVMPQCKITAPVTLSTATTICTWTLPNSAQTFSYQCQGTYSTSAAAITLLLGTQFAQAPSAGANNAIIWSAASAQTFGTATNTGTTAVPTMTGAAVSSGTNIPWQASGTFTSSATSGTFVIYGTASTATDVTIATGSSCNLF